MKYTRLAILIVFVFGSLNWSCHKSTKFERNYFAFGVYFSECEGNCATFYMISDDDLYADDMVFYERKKALKFKSQDLSNEKFKIAKQLMDNLPDYLKEHPNQTFGCPDCRDQGGFYIERKVNGDISRWQIDVDTSSIPQEIRVYVNQMTETLTFLK